ncbi:PREDICTED: TWiK family of potassium channels protein 18-like isoform X2 [Ceratosolen solmsi marchali]|uniref:TWiK family of potassium channels protein 18-like isoform X2 n=1 Tax=Ceratosolen solmsi marchali TaxID=326594 RepID=A0AAJ6YX94_9HYME|nr:PREDICTED: TWiK family of potassium channels protein 18-like isoform X2 [Ceratosolen solmsi marchali]
MEKERAAGCYRAYEGLKPANNGNTSSLKRPGQTPVGPTPNSQVRCLCFGSVPEKASRHSFLKGFLVNLAICAILVLYTLLGSFIFLYIEGPSEMPQQRFLATTIPDQGHNAGRKNVSWLMQINEARAHTVENLWITTEKLNILYHENWTRLASEELARFQEQVVRTLTDNLETVKHSITRVNNDNVTEKKLMDYEWNFARAFFYSLTVLTTIGYGSIAPRSTLGKVVTMGYAFVGIPLTLIYLSSAGGLLSRCARGVFTRTLCCCLCSNCGYCCYDERRMQEKERRMKKRRQQEELAQQQQQLQLQEPFYVRANASAYSNSIEIKASPKDEVSSLSSGDRPNVTILAPISICLGAMFCYIIAGAFTLHKLEDWTFTDASYFCFMSLSTIGFGNMVPGSYPSYNTLEARNVTVWFCSCYIMSGMALTAMCFNILHDEIVHRLSHQSEKQEPAKTSSNVDELSGEPFAMTS